MSVAQRSGRTSTPSQRHRLRLLSRHAVNANAPHCYLHAALTSATLHLAAEVDEELAFFRIVLDLLDLLSSCARRWSYDNLIAVRPCCACEADRWSASSGDGPGFRRCGRDGKARRRFLAVDLEGCCADGRDDGSFSCVKFVVRRVFPAGDVCRKRSQLEREAR